MHHNLTLCSSRSAADVDYVTTSSSVSFSPQGDSGLRTQRECVQIEILEDVILEDTEYFNVSVTSEADSVQVYGGILSVGIADNDYVVAGLKRLHYSVGEEEGSVTVCVEVRGEIKRTAFVQVSLETASGSAIGELHLNH